MKIINRHTLPPVIDHRPEIVSAGRSRVSPERCPSFQLSLWSFLIFNYHGSIRLGDRTFTIAPGGAFLTAPEVFKHHFPAEASFHYFAQLRFPGQPDGDRDYWVFELEEDYAGIVRDFQELLAFAGTDSLRAEVRLWDILQRLKNTGRRGTPRPQPLRQALEYIENHLDATIDITALATACGVSASYLVRLFRRHCGETVSGYIRRRRLELARTLLLNSDLPIREIAAECGIADLQYFNKMVRREFGRCPRRLRREN